MQELGYDRIGFVNLAIIYIAFSICSLFSVQINRKFGHKLTLFVSSLFYAIWAFVFILPAYKFE